MQNSWRIREYAPGDEEGIRELYHLTFDIKVDDKLWSWKYLGNPTGLVKIAIAETAERIIGQYAILPIRMKILDNIHTAALSLDTMVHPDYRGHGLFVRLAEFLYTRAKGSGISFIYGFPNESSHHGFVSKLGWLDMYEHTPLFVRPLDVKRILAEKTENAFLSTIGGWIGSIGLPLLSSKRWDKLPDGYLIKQITSFDERVDILWQRVLSAFNIISIRDSLYLNWRYVNKPGSSYTIFAIEKADDILGYIVLECIQRFGLKIGFIVDLLAVPGHPYFSNYLVSKAVEYFKEVQSSMLCCLMLKHSPYVQAVKANGFMLLPKRFYPKKMYLGVFRNTEQYSAEFLAKPDNWYITWGDHDCT